MKKILFGLFLFLALPCQAMTVGDVQVVGTLKADTFVKCYETTLTAAATSVSITSLSGNTDVEYILVCRFVNNAVGAADYYLRLNNDTGNNYGYQQIYGSNAVAGAVRDTSDAFIYIGSSLAANTLSYSNTLIYAKSGFVRTLLVEYSKDIDTTTIDLATFMGYSWNNTADEITSLVVLSSAADGLGIGTYICLYKKASST